MSVTLGKIQQLAEYVALSGEDSEDRVLELALDKLVAREITQLRAQRERLQAELAEFERQYGLSTGEFYDRFERGEMGDSADFMEWSATHEMIQNLDTRLDVLRSSNSS